MCLVNQVENESKRMKLFPYEELPSFAEGRQDQAYLASHMATPLAPAYGNQVKQADANEPYFDPDMRGSEGIHAPSQAAEKRKGNKLAVRRYRQKKKQELKSLLDGEWSKKKKETLSVPRHMSFLMRSTAFLPRPPSELPLTLGPRPRLVSSQIW